MSKISGPLLDRIDIHIEVPAVPFRELSAATPGSGSGEMRQRVEQARDCQRQRFAASTTRHNGQMSHRQIRAFCQLDDAGTNLLRATMSELGLSARAHDKILRLSRTIADLDDSERITPAHLSEAINYRMLDRQLWT
jgi:magnesium chelatase family protein